MALTATLIYWVIIVMWLAVMVTVCLAFVRNPRTFGAVRLLLSVIVIDTARNIVENLYFGLYFGAKYGMLPASLGELLGNPAYLIMPKALNVVAACAVLGLLVLRWLPLASKERHDADEDMQLKAKALNQETEERTRLFETSLDLILITDRRGNFTQVSPNSLATIGYHPGDMIGRCASEFIYPADLDPTRREMKLARSGRHTLNFETRYVHENGSVVPLAWSGVWSEPEQKYFFVGRDMTERRLAEEQLRRLALFDQLTSLPNRASLHGDLRAILERDESEALRHVTVAVIDVDGFKDVNDTLGHPIGDLLLREVARRMTSALTSARVYRPGEDEFVLLFENCGDPLVGAAAIDTLLRSLGGAFDLEGQRVFITASAGLAIAPEHGSTVDELLANAELALYDAKKAGGGISRMYVQRLRADAMQRLKLDGELRRACENREFVLYYQPQVRTADGHVTGAEALLRWNHPQRGVLAPGTFIDGLCESAVAMDVGRWVLATACATAAAWRAKGLPAMRIGVNLFPVQFGNGGFLQDVERTLAETGLPPDALELEITENIALGRDDEALTALKQLRASGVGIAFDDFGTGYASLSCLRRYPLTRIKIDRGFVKKIGTRSASEDAAILRSIIAMGRNLGLEVIAEGVETTEQARFLRTEGCQELQGFLISRPLSADAFERFLSANKSELTPFMPDRTLTT
ncbi:EAL domain-containing protein [Bradyrhizobium genosp. L]|uniref:putative bifunctional diguanylate cyclase/phosphodiesterase n=1 Tax=Bradyrhizobium genosp. L TaxID=83637 RepID=UPI0018A262C4|nr:EAL domain-containing protein [Bradyrhizobium genosp. L]QPF83806.1 EAL domain-containing protein [Bradyrhizobium genosp. L]